MVSPRPCLLPVYPLAWHCVAGDHLSGTPPNTFCFKALQRYVGSGPYSAAREEGTDSCKPAATASSRKDFTAPRESSVAVLVPSIGSLFNTSAGAVMM